MTTRIEVLEAFLVDRSVDVSASELIARTGLSESELQALVDAGAIAPQPGARAPWVFTVECLNVARTASRLRDELALEDAHALAVVLRLAQRVDALQCELVRLRALRGAA